MNYLYLYCILNIFVVTFYEYTIHIHYVEKTDMRSHLGAQSSLSGNKTS